MQMKKTLPTRRAFLRTAAAAAAVPALGFPAVVKLRRPNELLSHASIGTGNMARADLNGLRSHPGLHVTALCDVDANYLAQAKCLCPDARVYRNAFEMFEKEGAALDSVNVSTPDHTHAQYVLEALRRGLNVYGQKPLCHALADCGRIARLAAEKGAVTQMGTQIAAWECDRKTVAALRRGLVGEVRRVWLFSTRRHEPGAAHFAWPLREDPVPATLDWALWLGPAAPRPYTASVYHPGAWRKWRDFGTSWLGDLALHLMSPVWLGLDLGAAAPSQVVAEIADDPWTDAQRRQYWPSMSHLVWTFPGVKASGGRPFTVEWCDGFGHVGFRLEPKFLPPAFLQDVAAQTPLGRLPAQGRVVEGSEGWLVSTHYDVPPYIVMKDGRAAPAVPGVGAAPSHWHEYVNACLQGGTPQSAFAWTAPMTAMGLMGNAAQLTPGIVRRWCAEKGELA